jgi:hypothetical protein
LVNQIKDDAASWVKAGANGLRDAVLMTWDVQFSVMMI